MIIFYLFIILIPFIDSIFKFWIRNNLNIGETLETIIPFLKITYVKNFGAALGIFSGGKYVFIVTSILIIIFMLYIILIKKHNNLFFLIASSFIIGGGIGNLIDRIFIGFVTDYLQITFFPPVCNLSDYFISIGTLLFAIYIFKNDKALR